MTERKPEQLTFGESPPKQAAHLRSERRRMSRPIENLNVYEVYRLTPLIQEAVLEDSKAYREGRSERRAEAERILRKVWNEDATLPNYLHPSIVSRCLKWAGYGALEEELEVKQAPATFEAEMAMKLGTAGHYSLLRVLKKFGVYEETLLQDEYGISGRTDFMMKNPLTSEYQLLDLKFPGDWAFRQVKKEGLPNYLRKTKDIYKTLGPKTDFNF